MPTDMFYGATPTIFENARLLRVAMTPAEKLLWEQLKNNQFGGYRFKSQHPINWFITDFYCHKAKLIVELDGEIHENEEQTEYDKNRTYMLQEFGLTVVRFKNKEIFNQLEQVLSEIKGFLTTAT